MKSLLLITVMLAGVIIGLTAAGMSIKREESLAFVTIDKGYDSGVIGSQNLVIRDNAAWVKLWKNHVEIRLPQPEAPYINFAEDIVIAAFRGESPTGGYTLKIDSIERVEDRLVVHLIKTSPRPGAILTQAFTQPYHIVKIKRLSLPVEFVYK